MVQHGIGGRNVLNPVAVDGPCTPQFLLPITVWERTSLPTSTRANETREGCTVRSRGLGWAHNQRLPHQHTDLRKKCSLVHGQGGRTSGCVLTCDVRLGLQAWTITSHCVGYNEVCALKALLLLSVTSVKSDMQQEGIWQDAKECQNTGCGEVGLKSWDGDNTLTICCPLHWLRHLNGGKGRLVSSHIGEFNGTRINWYVHLDWEMWVDQIDSNQQTNQQTSAPALTTRDTKLSQQLCICKLQ